MGTILRSFAERPASRIEGSLLLGLDDLARESWTKLVGATHSGRGHEISFQQLELAEIRPHLVIDMILESRRSYKRLASQMPKLSSLALIWPVPNLRAASTKEATFIHQSGPIASATFLHVAKTRQLSIWLEFLLIVLLFLLSQVALAQSAISLSPAKGASAVHIEQAENYFGSCGSAAVLVFGVTGTTQSSFTIQPEAAKVIVRRPPVKLGGSSSDIVLSTKNSALSDHNGIACVSYKSTYRLLVWSDCGGSACGQGYSYVVVDPEIPEILAPRGVNSECRDKCAAELLGGALPLQAISR